MASDLGIPAAPFAQCLDGGRFRGLVEADIQQGRLLDVTGTPTFFINGKRIQGAAPYETFKAVIDEALRKVR